MVAVFTGLGAGFERGSGAQLGANGLWGGGLQGRAGARVSVNAATGNLLISRQDEFLVGRGPNAGISRTYNSQAVSASATDDNGDHWRQSTDRMVHSASAQQNVAGATVTRVSADGSEVVYTYETRNGVSAYWTTDGSGSHDTITYAGGAWTWTDGNTGVVERYVVRSGLSDWRLEYTQDRDGNYVSYSYAGGKLSQITTMDGGYIKYSWAGDNIASVETFANGGSIKTKTRTYYAYDSSNRLTRVRTDLSPDDHSVSDGKYYDVNYTYSGSTNLIASMTQSDGSQMDFSYDTSGRIYDITQHVGDGTTRVTRLRYGSNYTDIYDPSNTRSILYYDSQKQLTWSRLYAPSGGIDQSSYFTYDGDGNVLSVRDNEGNLTAYTYDSRGNVTSVTDPSGHVRTNRYDAHNNLIRTAYVTSTEASYDEVILEHFIYDSEGHLSYKIDGGQQVTNYRYDSYGNRTYEIAFTQHKYARVYTTPTVAELDVWRDGLDRTESQLTRHLYDAKGNLIRSLDYSDTYPNGLETTAIEGYTDRRYIYDSAGRLLSGKTTVEHGETYIYDGLGRVIQSTSGSGGTSTITFNDAATTTTVTSSLGGMVLSTYNKAGDLISSRTSGAHTGNGTAFYKYDKDGRVRMMTDETGFNTYYVYDDAGRKTAEVNHSGFVQEFRYNEVGQQVAHARYTLQKSAAERVAILATLSNPDNTLTVDDLLYSPDPVANHHLYDIWEWSAHDSRGQVTRTVWGDGSVTAYEYDQAGLLIKTHRYHNKLTSTQLANLRAGTVAADAYLPSENASKDQLSRTFYDSAGRVAGTLNGEGYLTRISYDTAGRKVQESAYANLTSSTLRASGTFDQLYGSVTKSSAHDAHVRSVYDGQGHLRFIIDARGKVTESVYGAGGSAIGRVRATIQHAATLAVQPDYNYSTVKAAVEALGSKSSNRVSWAVYNTHQQQVYSIDATGAVTGLRYDVAGNLTKTTQYNALRATTSLPTEITMNSWAAANSSGARITRNYYSATGQLRFQIDAEGYVTQTTYDVAGRIYDVYRYENPLSPSDSWTTATIAAQNLGASASTQYRYDVHGRLQSSYNSLGHRTYYGYYANGERSWEIRAYGQGAEESRMLYINDAAGRHAVTRNYQGDYNDTTDPAYRKYRHTEYHYDGLGNMVHQREDAVNHVPGSVERNTYFEYDKSGNLIKQTDAEGGITLFEHNAFGQVTRTTDPRGAVTTNTYNKAGQLTRTTDALGHDTDFTYTVFGESYQTTRAGATTTRYYDRLSRLTQVIDALGHFTHSTYDAFGNVEVATNKAGGKTYHTYDKRGFLVETRVPAGNSHSVESRTRFSYDSRGNRVQMIEAFGRPEARTTTYEYDLADRLIKVEGDSLAVYSSDIDGSASNVRASETYQYDRRGNLIESETVLGARTLYYYDEMDRVTHQISPTGTLTRNVYDANSNLVETYVYATSVSLPANATGSPPVGSSSYRLTTFTYDRLNRMTESRVHDVQTARFDTSLIVTGTGNDLVTKYLYDASGNVIRVTDPNGGYTHSYYDVLGRKRQQVDTENYLTSWTYDANGNVTQEHRFAQKLPDTVDITGYGTVPSNYPVSDEAAAMDQVYRDRITDYTYDANDRRLTETRRNAMIHDSVGAFRVESSQIRYSYNALGQVTSKRHATGDMTTYLHDNQGVLYSEHRDSYIDSGGHSVVPRVFYSYNAHNDLVESRSEGTDTVISHRNIYFNYGVGGRLESQTDTLGFTRTFRYNAAGKLLRDEYIRTTPQGAKLEGRGYEYDLEGRIVAQGLVAKPGSSWTRGGAENDTVTTTYNAYGDIATRGINGTNSELFAYDNAGRVFRTTTGDGTWKYSFYDNNGNQTLALASDGTSIDDKSRSEILALWGVGSEGQNANRLWTDYVDGVTATITRYDGRNQAIEVREPERQKTVSARADLITQRGYNAFGDLDYEIDANNARIDYRYNTMGRRIRVQSPTVSVTGENGVTTSVRPTELYYYDVSGRLVASRDANGNLTRQDYLRGTGYDGSKGLITRTIAADGGITHTVYDIQGNARRITDPLGRVTTQDFDAMGRVTQANHAGGLIDFYAYDGLGQQTEHWNNLLGSADKELTTYDAQGRVTRLRAFGGDVTSTAYAFLPGLDAPGLRNNVGGWQTTTTYANGRTRIEQATVFGQTSYIKDLGDHVTTFVYDRAGRLSSTGSASVQSYTYLNTGRLAVHTNDGKVARYGYDAVGNLISETLAQGSRGLRNATASYDALGRLSLWTEAGSGSGALEIPSASVAYAYDAQGNVRRTVRNAERIGADQTVSAVPEQTHWFRYDAMNRVVTDAGALVGGSIVRGASGRDIEYDAAGQRRVVRNSVADTYTTLQEQEVWENGVAVIKTVNVTLPFLNTDKETYGYDAAGRLETVHRIKGTHTAPDPSGTGVLRGDYDYDLMGRQTRVREWSDQRPVGNPSLEQQYQQDTVYNAKGQVASETTFTIRDHDTWKTITTQGYGAGSAYALGQVVSTSTSTQKNLDPFTASATTHAHVYYDGAVQASTTHDSDTSSGADALHTTSFTRDSSGDLLSAVIQDGRARTVHFVSDTRGQVVERREASPSASEPREVRHRFGGREVGLVGNDGQAGADLSFEASVADRTLTPQAGSGAGSGAFRHGASAGASAVAFGTGGYAALNSYNQGSTSGAYTARGGETLSSLATSLYGDASLWYKIAQSNPGTSPETPLIAGQSVRLPAGVSRTGYSASTLTPYDPATALGDLSPTTPAPPKAQKGGCGAVGQILLVVVAVAVTTLTAPYLTGGALGNVVGGAVAGATGSAASQAVGVATGIQDRFSWTGVGLGAIGGAVGGLGAGAKVAGKLGVSSKFASRVLAGSVDSGLTQGIGVATGLQERFSWAGVAAAGVGAGVGASALGQALGQAGAKFGEIGASVGVGTASALANAATRSALDGSSFGDNIAAAIPDVIGQAVGNAVGGAVGKALSGPVAAAQQDSVKHIAVGAAGQPANRAIYAQTKDGNYVEDEVVATGIRYTGLGEAAYLGTLALMDRLNRRLSTLSRSNVSIEDIGRNYKVPVAQTNVGSNYSLVTQNTFSDGISVSPFLANFLITPDDTDVASFNGGASDLIGRQSWTGSFGSVGQLDAGTAFLEFSPLGQFIGDFGVDLINLGRLQRQKGHFLQSLKTQALGVGKYGLMVGGVEAAGVHVLKRVGASLGLAGKGEKVLFSQRRMDVNFSYKEGVPNYLAGRNINDVAEDLAFGRLSSDDIMIHYFQQGNQMVSANTRGLAALSLAGRKPTNLVEVTASKAHRRRLGETPIVQRQVLPGPTSFVTPNRNELTVLQTVRIPD